MEHVNPLHLVAQLINFSVLVFLVVRLLGRSLSETAKTRSATIAKDLDEAARLRADAEVRLKQYDDRLANIEQEVAEMVVGIRKEAEAEKARIIAAAEAQAVKMRKDAEAQLAQEWKRLAAEVRHEAARAAIGAAEEILKERVSDADERRIAQEFVRDLAAPAAAAGAGRT
jgi:F-type H+-transporting ATPase subunit b